MDSSARNPSLTSLMRIRQVSNGRAISIKALKGQRFVTIWTVMEPIRLLTNKRLGEEALTEVNLTIHPPNHLAELRRSLDKPPSKPVIYEVLQGDKTSASMRLVCSGNPEIPESRILGRHWHGKQ